MHRTDAAAILHIRGFVAQACAFGLLALRRLCLPGFVLFLLGAVGQALAQLFVGVGGRDARGWLAGFGSRAWVRYLDARSRRGKRFVGRGMRLFGLRMMRLGGTDGGGAASL